MTKHRTKKPKGARRRAENPIERAAKRMAGKPDPYEKAVRHVTSRFGEALVKACDQLGQELATNAEWSERGLGASDNDNILGALLTLWKLRWELGLTSGGDIQIDAKAAEHAIESMVERSTAEVST